MRHFALHMLELNGGVVNAEIMVQAVFHIAQNPLAHRWRNIGDRDVAGERASLRSNAPAVEIVNIVDAFDGADGDFDQFELHSAGRSFEQNIQRLTHDAEA